jgi:hypothetical protein
MIKNKKQKCVFLGIIFYSCFLLFGLLALADFSTGKVLAAVTSDIARWYSTEQPLADGDIVSIRSDKGDYVQSAKFGGISSLLGVVVPQEEALVSIDQKPGVQVAIAGRAQAKVSTENGAIARGDLIGLSKTDGVGAKAREGNPVVGIAESSFGSKSGSEGQTGVIPIVISVGVAPALDVSSAATSSTWLKSIAGNDVSALQVAFVLFIAAVGLTSIVVLSYASIRNGVVAVGRNPLARPAILSALAQAMIMVSIVAISCFSLMYFILRL